MKNLIRKILKEDDWEWLRDIPEKIPFDELIVGQKCEVVNINQELVKKAKSGCSVDFSLDVGDVVTVIDKGPVLIDDVLCGCLHYYEGDCYKIVTGVELKISYRYDTTTFWFFDDMVTLVPTNPN